MSEATKLAAKKMKGVVMWASERDENGIILDENKNEYYFDRSTISKKHKFPDFSHNDAVSFKHKRGSKLLIAYDVTIASKPAKRVKNL